MTKTQQCLQYEEGKLRKKPENMFQVLRRLYNMEGLTGLYRGYSAGLLGTIHGGVQFYILEWLKRLYVLEGQKQTHFQMLFFPALSKVIGKTVRCQTECPTETQTQTNRFIFSWNDLLSSIIGSVPNARSTSKI